MCYSDFFCLFLWEENSVSDSDDLTLEKLLGSSSSTSPVYGGPMVWVSSPYIILKFLLMSRDLGNLIHGIINLDSVRLRTQSMRLLVEGK